MTERDAIYTEPPDFLFEFRGNPLIETLPPVIEDSDKVIDMLSYNEGHNDGERQYSPRYRMHFVLRLATVQNEQSLFLLTTKTPGCAGGSKKL